MKAEAFAVNAERGARIDPKGTRNALRDAGSAGCCEWLDEEVASVAHKGVRLVDDGASLVDSGVPPAVAGRPSSHSGVLLGEYGTSIADRRATHAEPCASLLEEHAIHGDSCASQLLLSRRVAVAGANEALRDADCGHRSAFMAPRSAFVGQRLVQLAIE
jgi:hypothetical protein